MELKRKISPALLTAVFSLQAATMASAADLTSVRYHSGEEHDRVVFDWSAMPNYTVKASEDGREITFDFHDAAEKNFVKKTFHSSRIDSVKYTILKGHILVKVRFKDGLVYKVGKLDNPARVYVDFLPKKAAKKPVAPGRRNLLAVGMAISCRLISTAFIRSWQHRESRNGSIFIGMMLAR